MRSRCHRSARALGTWLACRWWRRDGNALAGRVRRCCREAAAPPGTPFLGGRSRVELRSFVSVCSVRDATNGDSAFEADARLAMALPPLRTAAAFGLRHDSSRLVDEVAQGCGRCVVTPPAPLGPGWPVTGGRMMARHWQDACVDAVAKLPPLRARRFSETIRVELGAFLSIRAATTHPDSSTRWRTGAVAVSSLCPRPWDLVGVSLVAA